MDVHSTLAQALLMYAVIHRWPLLGALLLPALAGAVIWVLRRPRSGPE